MDDFSSHLDVQEFWKYGHDEKVLTIKCNQRVSLY